MCFLLSWRREMEYLVFAVFGYRRAVTDYNFPVLLSCSFPGPLIKDFAEVLFCFVTARAYISVLRVLATSSASPEAYKTEETREPGLHVSMQSALLSPTFSPLCKI